MIGREKSSYKNTNFNAPLSKEDSFNKLFLKKDTDLQNATFSPTSTPLRSIWDKEREKNCWFLRDFATAQVRRHSVLHAIITTWPHLRDPPLPGIGDGCKH
ncbi:hypothetical protein KIL84_017214 [Mauremys mutica]|uniref:Uncharacterized protein n=1 Tax=Mauremys mutica TaxID=74926 RepID=A0A9D3X6E3_9SAUR|nr:hypothetical protein KIL84_017214 [Mauremys mutica]